jgi:hypothetical protein
LFNPFSIICNYFCTVLVYFEFVVGKPISFFVFRIFHSIPSSFRIRSENDPPCNHFLNQLPKKKKIGRGRKKE